MLKTLIWVVLPFIFLSIFAVSKPLAFEPPPERDIFTVAIVGDRTGGEPSGLAFLERAVYEINQLNPDFVMHTGDMVQGYTRDEKEWLRQHKEFMSYMDKLKVFWYPVAGNHDVFTAIWDSSDQTYENLYKKHFGPLCYSFDYKNSHFVVMYTDEAMTGSPVISDDQIDWLKADLEGSDKTNGFIFMHKPVWRYNSNWDEVHNVLKGFPVRAVIAGHFHVYEKDVNRDGIQYYVMGATGGELYDSQELRGRFHHYNILRVEGDRFSMAVVKLGNVESDDYVLADDGKKTWNVTAVPSDKTGVRGWLWQPLNGPVEGEIEVYAHNPLDVSIPVQVKLNPHRGPWSIEPPVLGFTLLPGSDVTAKVTLSSPRLGSEDIIPPEFEFEYRYTDSHERKVPLVVRRRVLLRDIHEIHKCKDSAQLDAVKAESLWQQVSPLYNHTWRHSFSESHDAPPKVYIAADDANLYFFAEVMDNKYSYLKGNQSGGRILSDCIVFFTQPDGDRRETLIFPFNKQGGVSVGKVDERGILVPSDTLVTSGVEYHTRTDKQIGYYYCEGKIPLPLLFGDEDLAGKELSFNVGVVDNDLEAFVYLRTWAFEPEPQYWGILKFVED